MRLLPKSPKSKKSENLFAEVTSPPLEGTTSPRAILAKYESVFPHRPVPSVKSEFHPDLPANPPLPLMLPMNAFKTELLSPVTQLASKVSRSSTTPFQSMMPSPAFLTRNPSPNSLKPEFLYPPTSTNLNPHLDQHQISQERLFQNQHINFPQLTVIYRVQGVFTGTLPKNSKCW